MLVEDCILGQLENYFVQIALLMEPRYSVILDEDRRLVRTVRTMMKYRLTARDLREGPQPMERPVLAGRMRGAIEGCFMSFGMEREYQLTLEYG